MSDLPTFRRQIDAIDDRLLALLGERFQVVRDVAAWKAPRGIPAIIPERVVEVRERCAAAAGDHGMEPDFVRRLYDLLIDEACRVEADLMSRVAPVP
jgi:4-amino-4-deoxychorismate mutase